MASKYPSGPPPPYQPYSGYPQAGSTVVVTSTAGGTTVVQSGHPTTVIHPPPKQKKGLFGSFMKEVDHVGKQLGKEIDYMGKKINETVDSSYSHPLMNLFQTGNIVQLVSRSSGRTLQIMVGPNGQLVLDGNGPNDPAAFNTLWTVVNEGKNQVRLHNNNNYLVIINGQTTLIQMPPGVLHGVETKFQLGVMDNNFVILCSLKEPGRHIGVLPDGQLKPALACGREQHAQFGVNLISSPYPQPGVVTVTTTHHKK